jgi:hypothetical protein
MTSSCKGQEKQKSAYKLPNDSYVLDSTFISLKSSKFKIIILEKNKNKDIDEHYSNTLVVLKQNGNNYFEIYDNSKIVFNDDTNCPVDGYNSIVSKNNYFTIEQNICADFQFVNTYTTFKIDEITNEIFLHKYGQKYSDRSNPDRVIPDKTWTVKDFGKVNFVDFNKKFVIDLIQNNPKK